MTPPPPFTRLHLFTLGSFAVAQPLYDLIGRNVEFLVAHHAGRGAIAALVLTLSFALPLLVVAAVEVFRLLGRRVWTIAHRAAMFLLVALVVAGALNEYNARVVLPLATVTGLAAIFLYRFGTVRTFMTVLSPAVLVFPLVFLFGTPVSRLIQPHRSGGGANAGGENPTIVFVIFDELDTMTLLDHTGEIDGERFPNFAALAKTANWFPNAVAVHPYTKLAIPGILSGLEPDPAAGKLPIAADYPQNLFTWLGASHAMNVLEPMTGLCPADLCRSRPPVDTTSFREDVAVLYLHLITPRDLAEQHLPALAYTWKGFLAGIEEPDEPEGPRGPATEADLDVRFAEVANSDRGAMFRDFVRSIRPSLRPTVHFAHLLLPHDPYEYLPSGARYPHRGASAGMTPGSGVWTEAPALVETGRQRHIAQLQFVDRLAGELVARLKDQDLFDSSLIIIGSDHGSAFVPGESHRALSATNYRGLVAAPLLVKRPGQTTASVDPRRASGLDILPTIADIAKTTLPWTASGQSVLSTTFPSRDVLNYKGTSVGDLSAPDTRDDARKAGTPAVDPLVGQRLQDLAVEAGPRDIVVFSDSYRALAQPRSDSGHVPALVYGRIGADTASPLTLALAIDGTIQRVTDTAPWYGQPHFFASLMPEPAVQAGGNRLELLLVTRSGGRERISRIGPQFPEGLQIAGEGASEALVTGTGQRLPMRASIAGVVDFGERQDTGVTLHGWALDRDSPRALRSIAAFAGKSAVTFTSTRGQRPDVAAALGLKTSPDVVFAIHVEFEDLRHGRLRLFGIAADSTVGELQIGEKIRQEIEAHMKAAR
ncbi:MAG: sulfatase-like hydrolase/transferase [Vicinamibacterales bacterium]